MKLSNISLLVCSAALLASCGGSNPASEPVSSEPVASSAPVSSQALSSTEAPVSSQQSATRTITFDSCGGSTVAPITVVYGEKATAPADPTKDNAEFQGWFKDSYCVALFDFENTAITADWTLYAGWKNNPIVSSSEPSSSQEQSSSIEGSSEPGNHMYGPEGSVKVSWYLCGQGSLWGANGWSLAGGVQLFSNPESSTDKGCMLSVPFEVGDTFKVTDGTTWYGYEKVDKAASEANLGTKNFEGKTDGYGGSNFYCKVAGDYDFYVNGTGVFWIQAHAE